MKIPQFLGHRTIWSRFDRIQGKNSVNFNRKYLHQGKTMYQMKHMQ